jgi:hypothetical protein
MSPDWDGKPVTVPYAQFGNPQTLNLYSYAGGSPIIRVDATGHNYTGLNGYERDETGGFGAIDTTDELNLAAETEAEADRAKEEQRQQSQAQNAQKTQKPPAVPLKDDKG